MSHSGKTLTLGRSSGLSTGRFDHSGCFRWCYIWYGKDRQNWVLAGSSRRVAMRDFITAVANCCVFSIHSKVPLLPGHQMGARTERNIYQRLQTNCSHCTFNPILVLNLACVHHPTRLIKQFTDFKHESCKSNGWFIILTRFWGLRPPMSCVWWNLPGWDDKICDGEDALFIICFCRY